MKKLNLKKSLKEGKPGLLLENKNYRKNTTLSQLCPVPSPNQRRFG
jgi:hypothetical protein